MIFSRTYYVKYLVGVSIFTLNKKICKFNNPKKNVSIILNMFEKIFEIIFFNQ